MIRGTIPNCVSSTTPSNNVGSVKSLFRSLFRFFSSFFRFQGAPRHSLQRASFLRSSGPNDHGSFVIFRSASVRPKTSSITTSIMISKSNSLCRKRDAESGSRRSISRHFRFRAVPCTKRTLTTAITHNHSATSNRSELPACSPSLPWRCFRFDASPGVYTHVSSQDERGPLLGCFYSGAVRCI